MGNLNTPELRFFDFTGNWDVISVENLGRFLGGGTPDSGTPEFWQGNIPWISSSDIDEDSITQIKKTRFISEQAIKQSATKVVPKGAVLIVSRVGIGKFAVADEDICTSQDFINLVTEHDNYFLAYYFKARYTRFARLSQGTSIKGFTSRDLKDAKFAIPKILEQQKIAAFLSAVDRRIEQFSQKLSLLEQYKKGVMQQIFSRQIRFRDEKGNAFPDWEEKKLRDVCSVVGGGTPDTTKSEYWDGGIQWFTPTEIKNKYVTSSERTISKLGLNKSSAQILPSGAILLTTRATIGESSIALQECTTNQGFQSLIVKAGNNNEFIYYWLATNKHELLKKANGSTFKEIGRTEIHKISITLPALAEQTKIANFLSAIDAKIEVVKKQVENTRQFKKGLLQKMFV